MSRNTFLSLFVSALAGAGLAVGVANAGDVTHQMPPAQKQIQHPVASQLLGTWSTESECSCGGKGKGKATFALGVGGTAILQSYENTATGPDGQSKTFFGHGIYKISDDGKTATLWWLDNHSPEPIRFTGPLTANGYELSGNTPGGTITIRLEKNAGGFAFNLKHGEMEMKETYAQVN